MIVSKAHDMEREARQIRRKTARAISHLAVEWLGTMRELILQHHVAGVRAGLAERGEGGSGGWGERACTWYPRGGGHPRSGEHHHAGGAAQLLDCLGERLLLHASW